MSNDLGIDRSGNGNNWTVNNMAFADQVVDSPTNNFAIIDPLSSGAGVFSEGNLKYTSTADTGVATLGISSGKAYAEVTISSASNTYIGVCDISRGINPLRGGNWSDHGGIAYKQNGDQYKLAVGSNTSATVSYGASYTNGDIIGIAIDVDNDTITFYKNGVSQGNTASGTSFLSSGGVYSIMIYGGADMIFTVNFGQDSSFAGNKTAQGKQDGNDIGDFYYTPPTGFLALCTKNLPDATVTPSEHFNTVTWTGTGSAISVSGVGFQPDWVWGKNRAEAWNHYLFDAVRGTGKLLQSNLTNAETNNDVWGYLSAFNSDGFSLSAGSSGIDQVNDNSDAYVAWNWKANGSGSSNTDGDVTSTVSANVDSGFSIVTYTGNGNNIDVGHGLSKAPDIVIVKERNSTGGWYANVKNIPSQSGGADMVAVLNQNYALNGYNVGQWYFGSQAPTSSVFRVQNKDDSGANGSTYVAYCFHSVDGYSKIGSYTGNGNADGTFVYLGFRPAWVMIKNTEDTDNWYVADNKRDTNGNPMTEILNPNLSGAEYTTGSNKIDFTSNGIKCRDSASGDTNISGETYIYIAFAETPFKYSNAR